MVGQSGVPLAWSWRLSNATPKPRASDLKSSGQAKVSTFARALTKTSRSGDVARRIPTHPSPPNRNGAAHDGIIWSRRFVPVPTMHDARSAQGRRIWALVPRKHGQVVSRSQQPGHRDRVAGDADPVIRLRADFGCEAGAGRHGARSRSSDALDLAARFRLSPYFGASSSRRWRKRKR